MYVFLSEKSSNFQVSKIQSKQDIKLAPKTPVNFSTLRLMVCAVGMAQISINGSDGNIFLVEKGLKRTFL
jgi:hypothetical protein